MKVLALFAATIAAGILSLSVGPGSLSVQTVVEVLVAALRQAQRSEAVETILVLDFRLPRILLAATIGAGLGCSGALAQGVFRNALADSGVLGIGNGAALAVVIGFALGLDQTSLWATSTLAATGSFLVLLILLLVARGSRQSSQFLLSGVALGAILGAATTCVLSISLESWTIGQKAFAWLMGSLDARTWEHLAWCAPIVGIGLILAITLGRSLDGLLLGEDTAHSLGIHPNRVRWFAALAIALMVGASTAAVGSIAFVGLIVPHLARSWVGNLHRQVLPASALLGALLVVAVDTVSRAAAPVFLAPGALTSILGGLFFFMLLLRSERQGRWLA
jgi:iron complex transport system permease protein